MAESNIMDLLLSLDESAPAPSKKFKLKRLSDQVGKEVVFTLTALPYDEVVRLQKKEDDMSLYIVLEGVKDPDLHSKALMDKFDVPTPLEVIKRMLLPGEIEDLKRQIERLSGYRTSTLEEIKKK